MGGNKSPWLKLRGNSENIEEESQVEGVQATLDAMSESSQHGIKIGSLHFLVDVWKRIVPESHMVGWKMVCPETVSKQADMSTLGAFKSPHSNWVQEGSWRESDGLGGDSGWTNPPCWLVPGISKFERTGSCSQIGTNFNSSVVSNLWLNSFFTDNSLSPLL